MIYYRLWLIFLYPKINTLFLPFSEDFQIRVSDSRLDISANSERKWNHLIYQNLSLGVDNQKENQILKVGDVTIV